MLLMTHSNTSLVAADARATPKMCFDVEPRYRTAAAFASEHSASPRVIVAPERTFEMPTMPTLTPRD